MSHNLSKKNIDYYDKAFSIFAMIVLLGPGIGGSLFMLGFSIVNLNPFFLVIFILGFPFYLILSFVIGLVPALLSAAYIAVYIVAKKTLYFSALHTIIISCTPSSLLIVGDIVYSHYVLEQSSLKRMIEVLMLAGGFSVISMTTAFIIRFVIQETILTDRKDGIKWYDFA